MKQSIYKIILSFLYLLPGVLYAQSIKDVRINEIQVMNSNGLRDEYGRAVSWIELANCGYNKVNVAGCYLKVNGKEYRIPHNDPKTVMPTQGYLVFYAAGDADKGTLYTNLTLDSTNFISFFDSDGNLIDILKFNPEDMPDNVSYGWIVPHNGKEELTNLPATTPGASNNTIDSKSRAETFREADPSGLILTITSIAVVTIVLTSLCFIFIIIGNFHIRSQKKKEEKSRLAAEKELAESKPDQEHTITHEEVAAITAALHRYFEEQHDTESNILTINHVTRAYSPWSSKIHGLTKTPKKNK